MKVIPKREYVSKQSRHIRWNWEKSPESGESVRYHFIVVDDRNRKETMNIILEQIQQTNSGIEIIRERNGRVDNSRFGYYFLTFDTVVAPKELDLIKLGKPIRRDRDLKERERGSLENYVAKFYR